ncbi:MAG: hypothetical protein WAM91_05525 [Candidatus Acidiferrales bacterium]
MDASTKKIVPPLPQLPVLHYLLSTSDGKHVAHCLDLDLICVGATREEAARKLDDLAKAQIELTLATGQLVNLTTRAPLNFWRQFIDGAPFDSGPALRISSRLT